MSARILNALAVLLRGQILGPLHTICETQKQISTAKLEQYLEVVQDKISAQVHEVRMGYDTLMNTKIVPQPQPAAVPDGYALVPVKPTIEMVEAGYEAGLGQPDRSGHARVIEQYDTMLAAAPAPAQTAPVVRGEAIYVECRQCEECQHCGINDAAEGLAACHNCDWSWHEPEDDKCPGCQSENCMAAACPECGARYVLVASEEIAAAPSAPATVRGDASVPEAECRRLLFAFALDCNTIGLLGAAENLHKGMKAASSAAIAAARKEGGKV